MQLVMNVPYTAIHFATYESTKTFFNGFSSADVENSEETLAVQVSFGFDDMPVMTTVMNKMIRFASEFVFIILRKSENCTLLCNHHSLVYPLLFYCSLVRGA